MLSDELVYVTHGPGWIAGLFRCQGCGVWTEQLYVERQVVPPGLGATSVAVFTFCTRCSGYLASGDTAASPDGTAEGRTGEREAPTGTPAARPPCRTRHPWPAGRSRGEHL